LDLGVIWNTWVASSSMVESLFAGKKGF
jgi:hypothetical protein